MSSKKQRPKIVFVSAYDTSKTIVYKLDKNGNIKNKDKIGLGIFKKTKFAADIKIKTDIIERPIESVTDDVVKDQVGKHYQK